jgi:FKBP-type peptidyl-prolyl cis-trans isomerase
MKKIIMGISMLVLVATADDNTVNSIQQEHQQLFEKRKVLEEQSHNERIRILEEADSCVKKAKIPEEYKACEKKENESRQKFKEQQKPEHEALKKENETLKEKSMKIREERVKNRQYPKGVIETH